MLEGDYEHIIIYIPFVAIQKSCIGRYIEGESLRITCIIQTFASARHIDREARQR